MNILTVFDINLVCLLLLNNSLDTAVSWLSYKPVSPYIRIVDLVPTTLVYMLLVFVDLTVCKDIAGNPQSLGSHSSLSLASRLLEQRSIAGIQFTVAALASLLVAELVDIIFDFSLIKLAIFVALVCFAVYASYRLFKHSGILIE